MKVLQTKTTFSVSDEDVRYAIPCVGSPNHSKDLSDIKHILKTKKTCKYSCNLERELNKCLHIKA